MLNVWMYADWVKQCITMGDKSTRQWGCLMEHVKRLACPVKILSLGINEQESRGQLANPMLRGRWPLR